MADPRLDILLVVPPPWGTGDAPPLGTATLAGAGRAAGLRVGVFDLSAHLLRALERETPPALAEHVLAPRGLARARDLWTSAANVAWDAVRVEPLKRAVGPLLGPFWERIARDRPRVVGFSIYNLNLPFALELAAELAERSPGTRIVCGGPWTGLHPYLEYVRRSPVDAVVLGDGEAVLRPLVGALASGADPARVPGARVERSGRLPVIWAGPADLAGVPPPDYAAFDPALYAPGVFATQLARGCLNRCAFCAESTITPYRRRPLEAVFAEWSALRKDRGLTALQFNDQAINWDARHLEAACRWMADHLPGVTWAANAIVHRNLTPGLLAAMRRAGCEALNFGLESAADPVLSLMGKRFTAAQASEVLRRTREAGIDAGINLVVGFPGETDADREDTARFVEDNAAVVRSVQLVNPALLTYGSPLWGQRDRFEFYDPRRPVTSWIDGGNTPWTRRAWTAELIARCERAGVPVGERNFLDDLDATPQRLAEGPLGGGVTWAFVGGRIFLSQGKRMLSAGEGLFLDWDDEGGRRFGYDLDWADEGGVPTARGGPIRWRMARSTQGGALTIVLSAACDAPARLERIKVSMVLDEAYRRWRFAGQEGNLADESQWRRRWRPVGPADAGGRLPLSEGFAPAVGGAWTVTGDGVPALILAADGEGVLPVAQENCYPGSAVGFYRVGPISLPAGTTELLRLRLMLADAEN